MTQTHNDKLRHIWHNHELHRGLKLRLYKACICNVLTYGSEAWSLTTETTRSLNGANAQMMAGITGNTPQQEASKKSRTFDVVMWIRARRLQWLGHILRMGTERLLKQAAFEMFRNRKEGDMLMDAPSHRSWRELCSYAVDRDYWRTRVRSMKQPRIRVEGLEVMEDGWNPFTISVWQDRDNGTDRLQGVSYDTHWLNLKVNCSACPRRRASTRCSTHKELALFEWPNTNWHHTDAQWRGHAMQLTLKFNPHSRSMHI